MKKEARIKMFKSLTTAQRQELILKMKTKWIEVGSGVPVKKIWEWRGLWVNTYC